MTRGVGAGLAATASVAEPPGATTNVAGWVEMAGALPAAAAFTESVADALVTLPALLLTRTA